jgi:hypothetical protein
MHHALDRRTFASETPCPEAHGALGFGRLLRGDFGQAWPEDACWREHRGKPRSWRPTWDGTPLNGRTIFLYPDGGVGDALQYVRYAPLVQQCGGKVVIGCSPLLHRLFGNCRCIDRLVGAEPALPDFDVQAALMDLPNLFATTLTAIPADIPYLFADPELVAKWRRELERLPGFQVGLLWQGNPKYDRDGQRSAPLACFELLGQIPGVRLFSLQVGHGVEQLPHIPFPLADLGSRFDLSSFDDVAAVVTNLDLVISVDSVIAHLAGALGTPVWVALSYSPDPRWMPEREDSPWYPTMRLFRQRTPGDWKSVFDRMADELVKPCVRTSLQSQRRSRAGASGS